MEPLKVIKNEPTGREVNVSESFQIANQQSYNEGKRRGQTEGMQKEIARIKEFVSYLELLERGRGYIKTVQRIKEYYTGELKTFKIKEV